MTIQFKGLMSAAAAGALALCVTEVPALAKKLKLNHSLPEVTVPGQSLNFFAERVEALSGGELKIRVYHGGQLGSQRESVELVQQGALAIAKINASELETFEPLYAAFNLPYMFENGEHVRKVLTGDIGISPLDATADNGFIGLGYHYEGERFFYLSPETGSLADLAGKKIHVQPSPSAIRMVELLGLQATPISFGELYSALQQGVADGAEGPIAAMTDLRFGEVTKHFRLNGHTSIPGVYVISTEIRNGLSAEEQGVLRQAAAETYDFQADAWDAHEAKAKIRAA